MENLSARDYARLHFKNNNLTYSNIKSLDVCALDILITEHLNKFNNNGFTMELKLLRKKDYWYNYDGSIKNLYFKVAGKFEDGEYHFKEREAISFNTPNANGDFFIGFCGWADETNMQPFINAFIEWVDHLKSSERPDIQIKTKKI